MNCDKFGRCHVYIDQQGKVFKILFPSGSIPCSEENARKYPEAKKEQKRTKQIHKSKENMHRN